MPRDPRSPVAGLLFPASCCFSLSLLVACSSPVSTPTTFRIVNTGSRTLYLQTSGWSGTQEYLALARDGQALRFQGDCAICECSGCPNCAVCGRAVASVLALEPGGSVSFPWDGKQWVTVSRGCRDDLDCEQAEPVPPGDLTATVTYSDSFSVDTTLGAQDEIIGPHLSVTQSYRHPAATVTVWVQ